MGLKIINQLDVKGICDEIENDEELWKFASLEWWRLITPYTPMDTGQLAFGVAMTGTPSQPSGDTQIKAKEIWYRQPYAHRWYTTPANFRKDKHPLATAKWDDVARPQQEDKLIQALQNYIDNKWKGIE